MGVAPFPGNQLKRHGSLPMRMVAVLRGLIGIFEFPIIEKSRFKN
jgi:hypothetical protein